MTALPRSLLLPRIGGRRAARLVERNLMAYRRTWAILFSGFFEPVFYLLGVGFGVGALVGSVPGPDGQPIGYAAFVAPALMATSAMNGALFEATFNFFFKLKWQKTYDSILATPLSLGDVALGELAWSIIRAALYGTGFLVVVAAMGLARSPLAILALPASLLLAFAVGAVGMAASTFMRYWTDLDLIGVVILPVFLFSGTFYPVDVYPEPLRVLVWLSPLFHGTQLIRGLMLGILEPVLLLHVAVLVALGIAGLAVCARRLQVLLLK
jgi:lipooligosaccharide transport system permease protein